MTDESVFRLLVWKHFFILVDLKRNKIKKCLNKLFDFTFDN